MTKPVRYIAAGVRTDCLALLERFKKLNTIRYDTFANIWREMKFPYIYFGHHSFDELVEFTEETLRIAKEIWLKSELLNEQTCGLYMLYGLYIKQPTDSLVKVRVTSEQYDLIQAYHNIVREEKHHDANYILSRMYVIGAFKFCISDYPYGIEKSYRKYFESDRSMKEIQSDPVYFKSLNREDDFKKLEEHLKSYHKAKCELVSADSNKPPALLKYVDLDFTKNLKQKYMSIMQSSSELISTQKDSSENQKSSKKSDMNLPWWMIPINNRLENEMSSESEVESDVDGDLKELEKADSQDKSSELNLTLGLSGDEEDEDNLVSEEPQPGPSGINKTSDMPVLTL